jgi:hypothetical protein
VHVSSGIGLALTPRKAKFRLDDVATRHVVQGLPRLISLASDEANDHFLTGRLQGLLIECRW